MEYRTIKATKIIRWIIQKEKSILLLTVSLICGIIIILTILAKITQIGLWQINQNILNLKHITEQSIKTSTERKELKKQIELFEKENEEKQREIIRQKKAIVIYKHYRDAGTIYKWNWIAPELISNVILWEEKYHHLAKGFNWDTLNPENFDLCWVCNESNYCPDKNFIVKGLSGFDFWMYQMNQVHRNEKDPKKNLWRRIDKLYPELAKRPDSDPEKNCAVWHLWLGEQKGYSCWDLWSGNKKKKCNGYRKDVKELYFKLQGIK